ncbi:MAG: YfbK domain-containing protein, partial [Nannocystaceae bacterium]
MLLACTQSRVPTPPIAAVDAPAATCPTENPSCSGTASDGDGDGIFDTTDACPKTPGTKPNGCPLDTDKDGFFDPEDACPKTPGIGPDGCPLADTDNDGILDPHDQCVTESETLNGYEDADGCPDELPVSISRFTGVVRGVNFGGPSVGPGSIQPTHLPNRESYGYNPDNPYVAVADDPLSTFAADVDTASYSNVRRMLSEGRLPPTDAVRTEELINYFDYDYPAPRDDARFAVATEVTSCPWNPEHALVRIGIKGKEVNQTAIPTRNLVFLVDVSGSMRSANKLPLLKQGLNRLVETLRAQDRVAIVVYAGAAGVVLPPTSGANKHTIRNALARLEAGGSTAGGAGIELAYKLATQSFQHNGVNRVILASDGDFNVGPSSIGETTRLIEEKRKTGVFLTTLGLGSGNYNDHMMEQLADKGDGNYAYLDSLAEAEKVLVREAGSTLVTIARDVKLQVEFNPAKVKGYRQIGYENRQLADQDFDDDRKDAGELGAGHTVTALYEVIPVGASTNIKTKAAARRYQNPSARSRTHGDELLFIKVRSKPAKGGKS